MVDFSSLQLNPVLIQAITELGYTKPTPIQEQAIPKVLEGHDLFGCAQTGTGKTAAFLLPTLNFLLETPQSTKGRRKIQMLILTPTRELAAQIGENCQQYAKHSNLRHLVVFGGVKQGSQVRALQSGIDVLIATPGRLLDLQRQGYIHLNDVKFFILDEADRMLDMGFLPDIRRLLALLPKKKQNLLFSATMPKAIVTLAQSFLTNPVRIEVDPESSTVDQIEQKLMCVAQSDKKRLLTSMVSTDEVRSAIVFTRTKHGANRVVKTLLAANVTAAAIHGNKSQNARIAALDGFSKGKLKVLVATDVASRGIDISGISHVINYDIPNISETYVHRIGRTGRAGLKGIAIAFMDQEEVVDVRNIEKLIGQQLDYDTGHDWHCRRAQSELNTQRQRGYKAPKESKKSGSGGRPKYNRNRGRR